MGSLRLLVVDGNTREVNARHRAQGGRPTGGHYVAVLRELDPDVACHVVHPADEGGEAMPPGVGLGDFDGVAWSGSALNVYQDLPAVRRQVELAAALFRAGVPMFGSCWGLQVATVAAGGVVRPNPRGREIGFARHIAPTGAGALHPMYEGKRGAFDAIAVHMDEVAVPPDRMTVLASNAMSDIQAAEIRHAAGTCWGVQYHPEYDLNEICAVMARYGEVMVAGGFVADRAALDRLVTDLRALHADPGRLDVAWLYGIGEGILDVGRRRAEIANWLRFQVRPRAAERAGG